MTKKITHKSYPGVIDKPVTVVEGLKGDCAREECSYWKQTPPDQQRDVAGRCGYFVAFIEAVQGCGIVTEASIKGPQAGSAGGW
jgi:hypothetical protein